MKTIGFINLFTPMIRYLFYGLVILFVYRLIQSVPYATVVLLLLWFFRNVVGFFINLALMIAMSLLMFWLLTQF